LPLLERARVEVYVPDLPIPRYHNLLLSIEEEFTYAFGGCTISRGLEGSYLSQSGAKTPDRINLIYTDLPIALSTNFDKAARYADELKNAATEVLEEESVFVTISQIFHTR
jgi:hypothetical protein